MGTENRVSYFITRVYSVAQHGPQNDDAVFSQVFWLFSIISLSDK